MLCSLATRASLERLDAWLKSTAALSRFSFSANVRKRRLSQRESRNSDTTRTQFSCSSGVTLELDSFCLSRSTLAFKFGVPRNTSMSNRPGRVTAASNERRRFVATIKMLDWRRRKSLSYEKLSEMRNNRNRTCVSMAVVSKRLSIPRFMFSRSRQNSSTSSKSMMVFSNAFKRWKM